MKPLTPYRAAFLIGEYQREVLRFSFDTTSGPNRKRLLDVEGRLFKALTGKDITEQDRNNIDGRL